MKTLTYILFQYIPYKLFRNNNRCCHSSEEVLVQCHLGLGHVMAHWNFSSLTCLWCRHLLAAFIAGVNEHHPLFNRQSVNLNTLTEQLGHHLAVTLRACMHQSCPALVIFAILQTPVNIPAGGIKSNRFVGKY